MIISRTFSWPYTLIKIRSTLEPALFFNMLSKFSFNWQIVRMEATLKNILGPFS